MTVSTKHYVAVNLGSGPNTGTGDDLLTAFNKINQNFGNYESVGFPTGDISASGTVQAAYFIGDGSQITNLPLNGLYSNANTASYLTTYSGNLQAGNVTVLGNINLSKPLANVFVTGPMGFVSNAGSIVTQGTNKANTVVMSKVCGQIVTHNASLTANTSVGFRFQNAYVTSTDIMILNIGNGATQAAYRVQVEAMEAGNANIRLYNIGGGTLSEAITLNFALIKSVAS
jgi:hypothetical protein